MCSTVRNAKESYNELHQVKALVPIAHVTDSAAHARGLRNLAKVCNSVFLLHVHIVLEHAHVCAAGTTALTWQSMLWLSFAFLTMLHTSAALVPSNTYGVARGDRIYRVLKRAQVCMTNIDPHLCCNPRPGRLRSLPDASQTFF
jgi:hypothetical protein